MAFGTIVGHAVCTAGAVIGGRLLSTKISVRHSESPRSCTLRSCPCSLSPTCVRHPRSARRFGYPDICRDDVLILFPRFARLKKTVTLIGAAAFLFFAGVYFYEGWYGDSELIA